MKFSRMVLALMLGYVLLISSSAFAENKKSHFEQLELFNKIFHLVETQYYRQVDTNTLIEGAVKGMMDTLDPHSAFLMKESFSKMQADTNGEFGGLGIEVTQKEGVLYIVTPIDDTPAFKAGLRPGDKIVEINGEQILGLTLDDAVDRMRGKTGEKITIGIVREGVDGVKAYTLVREVIKTKPIKYEIVHDNYAFIRLTQFQRHSAESIVDALKKMKESAKKNGGIKGIILDLRYNPGGLLDEAVEVSSIFLKDGIVVSTEGRDPKEKDIRYVNKSIYKDIDTPLAVLINGASASASEIVAGALQDHKRAIIAGNLSFGKGSVQTVAKVDEENGVKLTIAQYMTPSGRKIQAVGIKPDIFIKERNVNADDFDYEENFVRERDLRNHLVATIETVAEKVEREKREKEERIKRIERIKRRHKAALEKAKEDKNGADIYKKYDPNKDYQVMQTVNYLESFKIFKNFSQKK